jgi:hypothetical protein
MGILILSKILFGGFHFGKENDERQNDELVSGRKRKIQRSLERQMFRRILQQTQQNKRIIKILEVVK